jgi:hypothetical protein
LVIVLLTPCVPFVTDSWMVIAENARKSGTTLEDEFVVEAVLVVQELIEVELLEDVVGDADTVVAEDNVGDTVGGVKLALALLVLVIGAMIEVVLSVVDNARLGVLGVDGLVDRTA